MYNLLHLKYAVEVAKAGSISKAAEQLYMGQPHLSKAIRELEESLGITVFHRTPKGVTLTRQGEEFLEYARDILAKVERMEAIYRPDQTQPRVRLNFCASISGYLTEVLAEFVQTVDFDHKVELRFTQTDSWRVIRNVAKDRCGWGIIRYPQQVEGYVTKALEERSLHRELIWSFEGQALLSRHSPLAGKRLLEESMLTQCMEMVTDDSLSTFLSAANGLPEEEPEKGSSLLVTDGIQQIALLQAVPHLYLMESPLPEGFVQRALLLQKRCRLPQNHHCDALIYRKGYHWNDQEKSFLTLLENMVKKLGRQT